MVDFAAAVKQRYDANSSTPYDVALPRWESFRASKSGRYPEIVSNYRRIKKLAEEVMSLQTLRYHDRNSQKR